tara:strand:+ start:2415 stop:2642 length:228 start_codon:yes stop_codon:yes gene_type:complete
MTITLSAIYVIIAILGILLTGLAIWVRISNEMTKLKSRVHYLETNDTELKAMLAAINAKLQHIEILLASNHIKEK